MTLMELAAETSEPRRELQNTTINIGTLKNDHVRLWVLQPGYTILLPLKFFTGAAAKHLRHIAKWAAWKENLLVALTPLHLFAVNKSLRVTPEVFLHILEKARSSLKGGCQDSDHLTLESGMLKKHNHATWPKSERNLECWHLQGSATLCSMLTVLSHH